MFEFHFLTDDDDKKDASAKDAEGKAHKSKNEVSKEEAVKAVHTILSFLTGSESKSKGSKAKKSKNSTDYLDIKAKESSKKPQNKVVNPTNTKKKDSR